MTATRAATAEVEGAVPDPDGTDPAPPTEPGMTVWVLPDRRPAAACWARRPTVPRGQDQLALDPDFFPPDGGSADTHHNRAAWFAVPPAGLPDPRRFACSLAQAVAEVLVGRRPAAQLVRWVEEEALAALNWQLRTAVRGREPTNPPAVCSVRLQLPARRVVEVAVHLRGDGVPPAMALRLEARTQRWFCTALELGPDANPSKGRELSPATGSSSDPA